MRRRQEERIEAVLTVRIWGTDSSGKPFMQNCRTVDISRTGAQLDGAHCFKEVGVIFGMQHGNVKARFRVVWIGQQGTAKEGRVGVRCLEPEKGVWGVALSEAATPEGVSIGGVARDSTWVDRRKEPRYECDGQADLRSERLGIRVSANLRDISSGGCYVGLASPWPVNTEVNLVLKARDLEICAKGLVCASHPGAGMGVAFTQMSDADGKRLDLLLQQLEAGPELEILRTAPASTRPEVITSDSKGEGSSTSNSQTVAALEFLSELLLDKGMLTGEEFAKLRKKLKAARVHREENS